MPSTIRASTAEGDLDADSFLQWSHIKPEAFGLVRSSLPIVLSSMTQLFLMVPMLAAVGRLGTAALASMNLASTYAGLAGIAPLSGIAMALDTLCSQAYTAAKDKRLLGVYVQRAFVCTLTIQALIYPIWWNSNRVYEYLGVPAEVAELTGRLLRLYFFGVAALFMYECLKSFLFAQGIRRFAVISQAICLPIGWLLIWLLIANPSTSMGILGVSATLLAVAVGFNIVTLVFIFKVDGHQCWGGWSRAAFADLRPMFKLGLAGSLITFFESVALHMIDLGSMFLGAKAMAAQAVLSTLMTGTWVMGTGFSVTACNRVGNHLGSGLPNRAVLSVYTTVGLAVCAFSALGTALVYSRHSLPHVFTSDPAVAQIISTHIPWSASAGAIQGVNMAFNGILRGQGRQILIARIRILSFVGVAIPLGVVGVKVFNWGLAGLWLGYVACLLTTLGSQLYVVSITNWSKEVDRCQKRVANAMLTTSLDGDSIPVLP
ncbi:MATE efflux family protein [Martensiomyces pterosporus]|nr:MATE efflux family protein [Martensiomyces pterosporus]